jgi:hypothetical protein
MTWTLDHAPEVATGVMEDMVVVCILLLLLSYLTLKNACDTPSLSLQLKIRSVTSFDDTWVRVLLMKPSGRLLPSSRIACALNVFLHYHTATLTGLLPNLPIDTENVGLSFNATIRYAW